MPPAAPPAEPNPADLVCAQGGSTVHAVAEAAFARSGADEADGEAVERAYLDAQRSFHRCVGCREVYYCAAPPPAGAPPGSTCQKLHWPSHRAQCNARRSPEWADKAGPDFRPGYWPPLELVCIFQPLHQMSFGDLERFDRLGFVAANIADLPCPLAFVRGIPRRPSAVELHWLLRAMAAVIEFARKRPDLLNDTFSPTTFSQAEIEEELSLECALPAANRAPASEGGAAAAATELNVAGAGSEAPWFEAFGEGPHAPTVYVRADAILSPEEAKNQRREVAAVVAASHDEKAIKPGLYVPSRASFLVGPAAAAPAPGPSRCAVS